MCFLSCSKCMSGRSCHWRDNIRVWYYIRVYIRVYYQYIRVYYQHIRVYYQHILVYCCYIRVYCCYIRLYCCYIRVNIHVNTLNEFWGIYAYIYALLYAYIRVTLFVYNVTFAKGVNHSNPIKPALVTTFNVTCNCKLMRAVKEENSPNYNDLKQLEGTYVGDLKAECHRSKIYVLPDEQVHVWYIDIILRFKIYSSSGQCLIISQGHESFWHHLAG